MRRSSWLAVGLVLLTACKGRAPNTEASATMSAAATRDAAHRTPAETALPTATSTPTPTEAPLLTPTPQCESPQGRLLSSVYPGTAVQQDIPVRVFVPPCYEQTERLYPTLYLLHGKPLEVADWDDLGADELAGEAMASGMWPAFLIVMPVQPEPLFSNSDGGPWSYEAEFVDGLLPWVEQNFRADPRPEARALAGISRGGIWALEIAFRHADLIDSVAALSPSLMVNYPRPDYDPFNLAVSGRSLPSRIFLAAGEQDWARAETDRLHEVLQTVGANPHLVIVPGEHAWDLWHDLLGDSLAYVTLGFGGGW